MPDVFVSSWFINTVKVPSPLSNAPSPSGIPTIRYGVPSGLLLTESPTVRSASVETPGAEGSTYAGFELLGSFTWANNGTSPPAVRMADETKTDVRLHKDVITHLPRFSRLFLELRGESKDSKLRSFQQSLKRSLQGEDCRDTQY